MVTQKGNQQNSAQKRATSKDSLTYGRSRAIGHLIYLQNLQCRRFQMSKQILLVICGTTCIEL